MKLIRVSAIASALIFLVTALAAAQAATKPVPTAKPAPAAQAVAKPVPAAKPAPAAKPEPLPKPILDAFTKAYPKAVIKNSAKETEGGKTTWEVESTDNGLARDLVYNPDGTVVDIEEEVAAASLPPAVSAALKAKYPKATITKAEKLFKGKTLTYEMAITGAGAVKSAEFTPEGKLVPPAKADTDKEEKEDAPKPAKPVVKK